jgi:AcrR family transcriptional regulator
VIDVALLGIIRRWYIRDRISIREIARRLDISRNTVRRYIRSDVSDPTYPARCSPSSLDEFTARLSAWLSAEASFIGFVDGLALRGARSFGAGRESDFIYHRVKASLIPLATDWYAYAVDFVFLRCWGARTLRQRPSRHNYR